MNFNLPPDPWEVLKIPTSDMTNRDVIRRNYLKLVLKCHPDKVADDQVEWAKKEFPRVQQAYELLMNDADLGKYLDTRRKQEQWNKAQAAAAAQTPSPSANMANTSAARTPPREFTTYKPRTAEPKATTRATKGAAAATTTAAAASTMPGLGRAKVYTTTYTTAAHSRSQEEMPTAAKVYPTFVVDDLDDVKGPRRAASYEETAAYTETRRAEARRDEKRRRDKAERLDKEYYLSAQQQQPKKEKRERKERDGADLKETRDASARDVLRDELAARKAEKKVRDRDRERASEVRDRERKREADDKRRQNKSPYVEPYEDDKEDSAAAPKTEREKKGRSGIGGKKHDEARGERDKSASRLNRSPAAPDMAQSDKTDDHMKFAASYMSGRGTNLATRNSASMPAADGAFMQPPEAPTPPNGFEEEESIRLASARAAGRRSSRTSKSSREKMSREYEGEAEPIIADRTRTIPVLSKSTSSPPTLGAGNSPPRIVRASTMPTGEGFASSYTRTVPAGMPPSFARTKTWGGPEDQVRSAGAAPEYFEEDSDEDRPTIATRRSGRRGSNRGESTVRYKVAGYKTSRMDYPSVDATATYGAPGTSPTARRFLDPEQVAAAYAGSPFSSVKQSRHYTPYDVKYSDANVSYTPMPRDQTYAYQVAS